MYKKFLVNSIKFDLPEDILTYLLILIRIIFEFSVT